MESMYIPSWDKQYTGRKVNQRVNGFGRTVCYIFIFKTNINIFTVSLQVSPKYVGQHVIFSPILAYYLTSMILHIFLYLN